MLTTSELVEKMRDRSGQRPSKGGKLNFKSSLVSIRGTRTSLKNKSVTGTLLYSLDINNNQRPS